VRQHRGKAISAAALVALLVGILTLAPAAHAATPATRAATASAGTISPGSPSLTYTGGPFSTPNQTGQLVTPPTCNGTAADQCDVRMLNVDTSAAGADYATTHSVSVSVSWPDTTDEFDIYVQDTGGNVIASAFSGTDPQVAYFPAATGAYTVTVVPSIVKPTDQNNMGEPFTATITLARNPSDTPAAPDTTNAPPRYQTYIPPTGPADVNGIDADEPSIGSNWNSGNVLYQSLLQTLRVRFDDRTSPAGTSWVNAPAPTSLTTLDPILFTDHTTGRTIVSQLAGTSSLSSFTDNDGASYMADTGSSEYSGVDHQSVGGGPYSPNGAVGAISNTLPYTHATYYCSQDVVTAFCALSENGGQSYGPSVPIYTINQCIGIHGHVKVAPDGTVYVPNRDCDLVTSGSLYARQGMAVSTDNGATYTVRYVPDSTSGGGVDPSVGIGQNNVGQPAMNDATHTTCTSNTLYFGYHNSDGHPLIATTCDRGLNWTPSVDVGVNIVGEPGVHLQNITFPVVVAGDDHRAAFAFLGTATGGNYQDVTTFHGVWHAYIATTYDGGKTWTTVDTTPNDAVQRGSICNGGTTCGNDRNLFDFNDMTIDKEGRPLFGYADGCLGGCVNTEPNTYTHLATIARQSGGHTLFSRYDALHPETVSAPATPTITATQDTATGAVTLSWDAPDNGGAPITGYRIFRRSPPGALTLLATVNPTPTLMGALAVRPTLAYTDTSAVAGQTYVYRIAARNVQGLSPRSPAVRPVPVTAPNLYALPGILAISDTTGDQKGGAANADLDIQSLSVAQPATTTTPTLVFTIKVADLSTLKPNREWRVRFFAPPNNIKYYAAMKTNGTGVSYEYGIVGTTESMSGTIGGSYDQTLGTITLYLPASLIPNLGPGQALGTLGVDTYADTAGGKGEAGVNTAIDMAPDSGFDSGSTIYTLQPFMQPASGTGSGGTPTATPEPGSGVLYASGLAALLAGLSLWRSRRGRRARVGV